MNYTESLLSGEPVVIDSGKNGPNVVILCSVHGNEHCGVEALKSLLPTINIKQGKITCILANPRAYEQNVRFTEANLNRVFRPKSEISPEEINSYEYQRAQYIMPFLENADYILDLHSVTDPGCKPFVICSSLSFDIAKQIGTDVILSGLYDIHPGGTDGFMNRLGKYAICIECGQHTDPNSIIFAEHGIKRFLSALGLIESIDLPIDNEVKYLVAKFMYTTKTNFTPAKEYKNFETVKKGEVVGIDGDTEVISQYNGFIIFCHKKDEPNQEAFVLGEFI